MTSPTGQLWLAQVSEPLLPIWVERANRALGGPHRSPSTPASDSAQSPSVAASNAAAVAGSDSAPLSNLTQVGDSFFRFECDPGVEAEDLRRTLFPRFVLKGEYLWPVKLPRATETAKLRGTQTALELAKKIAAGLERRFLARPDASSPRKAEGEGIEKRAKSLRHFEVFAVQPSLKAFVPLVENALTELGHVKKYDARTALEHVTPGTKPAAAKSAPLKPGSRPSARPGALPQKARPVKTRSEKTLEEDHLVVALFEGGVLAGVQSARKGGSVRAGRTGLVASIVDAKGGGPKVSRAAGKFAEARECMALLGFDVAKVKTWLELGAAPGGITAEIAALGARVYAVDRAPLDEKVVALSGVVHVERDAATLDWEQPVGGIVCDMNGSPRATCEAVARVLPCLQEGGPLIMTLKIPAWAELEDHLARACQAAASAGVRVVDVRHMFRNRQELTLLGIKETAPEISRGPLPNGAPAQSSALAPHGAR